MMKNSGNLSLPMAIWLASDDYDHDPTPNVISATELLKSVKQILLGAKAHAMDMVGAPDLQDQVASRIGTAIHTAVETSVLNNRDEAMKELGLPPGVRKNVRVNPTTNDPEFHNIYMEQRVKKSIDGWVISGMYDIVEDGRVKDIKSTSTYTWVYKTNDKKYTQQGSIYRWLNPELITDDMMDVEFVFIDWKALSARTEKNYPPFRVMSKTLSLMSYQETEFFIREKLALIVKYQQASEAEMPECNREELWQKPTTFAYYKNPDAKRATKVGSESELNARMADDGFVGVVRKRPGKAKHCLYCPARAICAQAERLQQAGLLE